MPHKIRFFPWERDAIQLYGRPKNQFRRPLQPQPTNNDPAVGDILEFPGCGPLDFDGIIQELLPYRIGDIYRISQTQIDIEIIAIRIQRLLAMKAINAVHEGIQLPPPTMKPEDPKYPALLFNRFGHLWNQNYKRPGLTFADSPWVAVYRFDIK